MRILFLYLKQLTRIKNQEVEEGETDHEALMDGYVRNICRYKFMFFFLYVDGQVRNIQLTVIYLTCLILFQISVTPLGALSCNVETLPELKTWLEQRLGSSL